MSKGVAVESPTSKPNAPPSPEPYPRSFVFVNATTGNRSIT